MPLQATSGAASYDAFGGGVAAVPQYIEDVFSTFVYAGNSTNRSIVNDIDLSGKGGLVWIKDRNAGLNHTLFDTARGATNYLFSDSTNAQDTAGNTLTAFNSNGFNLGTNSSYVNGSGYNYASWTFRKQPKFFDVVTYTGTGSVQNIAHNLGSVPGCIIIKAFAGTSSGTRYWAVYHQSLGNTKYVELNTTNQALTNANYWNSTTPTSTQFTIGSAADLNASGNTFVAYLFAHDAGGFGLTGTDNVISCGSFTTDGSGNASVTLGYEPQWMMLKSTGSGGWFIRDTMRGFVADTSGTSVYLAANTSSAEGSGTGNAVKATGTQHVLAASTTYIYIAIRRGPMKVPTTGTKVFSPTAANNAQGTVNTTGFPVDMQIMNIRSGYGANGVLSTRLLDVSSNTTSSGRYLRTPSTSAESASSDITQYWDNTGFQTSSNWASSGMIYWSFGRAPSCMDVVCYTGTGVATTVSHNLQAVPELMIIKSRTPAGNDWIVYAASLGNQAYLQLNRNYAVTTSNPIWNNTTPTSSVFSLGTAGDVNGSGNTQVAYLFATLAGVSKVGSYTGTDTLQTINCGFTGGARFVLIKRTNTTGNWFVWDTARGMVSGTDPSLMLNNTSAETNANSVYTIATGFQILGAPSEAINNTGDTYIFLAIA